MDVQGANAGVHLVVWLRDLSPSRVDPLVTHAAAADVGVYPVAPYYLGHAPRAGLLLGYAGLDERAITEGIRRLARVIDATR